MMRTLDLFNFIQARHKVYTNRLAGKPKPWTADTILQRYRFCNMYRELDTVTQWIAKNWRQPHAKDQHLWFAMVVARLFNLPSTLAHLGYPVPFNPDKIYNVEVLHTTNSQPLFNGAYIVSTNGHAMAKVDYLVSHVLQPLWTARKAVTQAYQEETTLYGFHSELIKYNGLGSFMAAQVIADLKYVAPLKNARDWDIWAASGPGSRRGLNRVMDRAVSASWTERDWLECLRQLQQVINPHMKKAKLPQPHAQDLQNCLCEFDKYERVRLGEGTPKQRYPGLV